MREKAFKELLDSVKEAAQLLRKYKKMYDKLLFLDFDGVMTSMLDGSSYLCRCSDSYRMSDNCKSMMSKLFKAHPDIRVVVHSSWLKFHDPFNVTWTSKNGKITVKSQLGKLINWLNEKRVYLDNVDYNSANCKAERIRKWLAKNSGLVADDAKILILDDDGSQYNMLHTFDYPDDIDARKYKFIEVNPVTGFNEDNLKEAIEFFPDSKSLNGTMTLDEAIEHAIEVSNGSECEECMIQHRQLAEWLKELKTLRKLMQDYVVDIN